MKIKNWLGVKNGDKVKIRGEKVEIINSLHVKESNNLATFVFLKMREAQGEFYLFARIVDENVDVRIFNEINWLGIGDRGRLLNEGNNRLFQAPQSENWVPSDLEWTESFEFNIEGENVGFNKKFTSYGEATERPKTTGVDVSFASVVEYNAVRQVPNPEIVILELGGIDPDGNKVPTGGLVIPLEGYCINNSEVETVGWFF